MEKKLQVFISSTFTDMVKERQAAVEAILNAGHIPTGMEQFNPGDEPQKKLISRWINEADVYLLILGGRYGSIDSETGNSFTHWEYNYAGETGMPRFALVMKEYAIEEKARSIGIWTTERENYPKYREFRTQVLEKMSRMFSDTKDIQLAVTQKLAELEKEKHLIGWISAKDIPNVTELEKELSKLKTENEQLKIMLRDFQATPTIQPNRVQGDYLKFLILLSKVTKGRLNTMVSMWELGSEVGFEEDKISQVAEYLEKEGLLEFMAIGGDIAITHSGVKLIDDLRGEYPPLSEVEKAVLKFLFDRDNMLTEENSPNLKDHITGGSFELAFYIKRLEGNDLIRIEGNPYTNGGRMNQKYQNNVLMVDFNKIKITNSGTTALQFS